MTSYIWDQYWANIIANSERVKESNSISSHVIVFEKGKVLSTENTTVHHFHTLQVVDCIKMGDDSK